MLLYRKAEILIAEFGEVLQVSVYEKVSKGIDRQILIVRLFNPKCIVPAARNWSIWAQKGIVPNQISKEIFFITNFLDERDWLLRLDEYDSFCSTPL